MQSCRLCGKAFVSRKKRFFHRTAIHILRRRRFIHCFLHIAKKEKIPYQKEVLTYGGTDTSSMQFTGLGAMAGAISVPTRNIHSAVEICDMKDVKACIDLAEKYILSLGTEK